MTDHCFILLQLVYGIQHI